MAANQPTQVDGIFQETLGAAQVRKSRLFQFVSQSQPGQALST
jgi:hypothetical protein